MSPIGLVRKERADSSLKNPWSKEVALALALVLEQPTHQLHGEIRIRLRAVHTTD